MPKTIILAEVHLDPLARELFLNNLYFFILAGYTQFAFEHDFGKSIEFEIESLKSHVENMAIVLRALMQDVIPASEITPDLTYALLSYPSNAVLYQLLLKVQSCAAMSYAGIDKPLLGDRF